VFIKRNLETDKRLTYVESTDIEKQSFYLQILEAVEKGGPYVIAMTAMKEIIDDELWGGRRNSPCN
jgi:hypothetical protein